MRLENTKIGSQPLQHITRLQQGNVQQQTMVRDHDNNEQKINADEIERVVFDLNEFLKPVRTNVKFELHEELNEYYVTIIDANTNEKLKEIPPKKMLDMYAEMAGYMGLLVDEKI